MNREITEQKEYFTNRQISPENMPHVEGHTHYQERVKFKGDKSHIHNYIEEKLTLKENNLQVAENKQLLD